MDARIEFVLSAAITDIGQKREPETTAGEIHTPKKKSSNNVSKYRTQKIIAYF